MWYDSSMPLIQNSDAELLVGKTVIEVEHFPHGVYIYCSDGTKVYLYPQASFRMHGMEQAAKDDTPIS